MGSAFDRCRYLYLSSHSWVCSVIQSIQLSITYLTITLPMSQTSNRARHRQRLVSVQSANSSIVAFIEPTLTKVSPQSLQQEPKTTKDHRPGSRWLDSTSTQDHPVLNPTPTTSRTLRQGITSTRDSTLLSPTLTTSQSLQQKPASIKVHTSRSLPPGPISTQHHLLVDRIPTKSWPLPQGPTSIENYSLLSHTQTISQPLQQGTPFSGDHTLPKTVISHLTRITPHTTLTASQKASVSDISPTSPVLSTSWPNGNSFSSSRGHMEANIYPVSFAVSAQPTATRLSILHLNLSEIQKLQTEYPGRVNVIYMAVTHTSTLSPHAGVQSSSTTFFSTSSKGTRLASIRHQSTVEDIKLVTVSNTGTGSSIILQPTPYPERISIYPEFSGPRYCHPHNSYLLCQLIVAT